MTEAEAAPERAWAGAEQAESQWIPATLPSADRDASAAPAHRRAMLALKRSIDVLTVLFAVTVLAPAWLLIAALIKLDSPGPVLFRQRRVGRDGRLFTMFKFRTMIEDADRRKLELLHLNEAADGLFKINGDPRVTRFGQFLRSTSLDELPQVINVFLGTMSLVGPRPLVPEEDGLIEGTGRDRLRIRPGITGAWQVAGASSIPLRDMVRLDLDYLATWSLWGDLKLILGTLGHVVRRRGV